ncbi:hypothetical protein KR51_00021540 [Rubidibacter lacunae KORDI 51-2]|uniref:Uncharacterized protein n=1 Tax=Rubidibacter lacunae KORDI 51-2 TaxID=582515 RepID=U5DL21_9CHRO|nr:hypothetical protein [Rubidibacter lacunae]ERN41264.1 hypothetical protein KR51_00021540 [Rubidibacter lacunae KORDI 51-2]
MSERVLPQQIAIVGDRTNPISAALQSAIARCNPKIATVVVAPEALLAVAKPELCYLPLELELPVAFQFPGRWLWDACREVEGLQARAARDLSVDIATADLPTYWLPVALTARGPLYGEAIASNPNRKIGYVQPADFPDRIRQSLYALAFRLLRWLDAPAALYLVEVGTDGDRVAFSRLWPFPAAPALASLGVQQPDLFTAHWLCVSGQPLLDLVVRGDRPTAGGLSS